MRTAATPHWHVIVIRAVEQDAYVQYSNPEVAATAPDREGALGAARALVAGDVEEASDYGSVRAISEPVDDGFSGLWPDEDGFVIEQVRATVSACSSACGVVATGD